MNGDVGALVEQRPGIDAQLQFDLQVRDAAGRTPAVFLARMVWPKIGIERMRRVSRPSLPLKIVASAASTASMAASAA
jgi:hypothetical protein